MREVADRLGVADTFDPTPVGVFFGTPGERERDPYFGGEGPDVVGCIACVGCMVGCRHEAKNTLDRNYLYLAEKRGAQVLPEREVCDLEALYGGGWRVTTRRPGAWLRRDEASFTAGQVVLSAGSLGTQKLLFKLRDEGRLAGLSPRLGSLTRTNSEAIVGATANAADIDYSEGVAITSSIQPDANTHIEPVRYPKGSAAIGLISTIMVDGGGSIPRWLRFLLTIVAHPVRFLRSMSVRKWSQRTVILLVMQSLDNSLQVVRKRGLFGHHLSTREGHGDPNPTWIPIGKQAAREAADVMDGLPLGSVFEATMNVPTTAHIIGGCPIGDSIDTGVIDPYHRVYGYDGLTVRRVSDHRQPRGQPVAEHHRHDRARDVDVAEPRRGRPPPPLGAAYAPVVPVRPTAPAVPDDAPAALRLPLLPTSP